MEYKKDEGANPGGTAKPVAQASLGSPGIVHHNSLHSTPLQFEQGRRFGSGGKTIKVEGKVAFLPR